MVRKKLFSLFALALTSIAAVAQTGFNIDQLPSGKAVMLPHSTPPLIPMGRDISVASTEKSQTIMLTAIYGGSQPAPTIRLSIHDPHAPKAKNIDVKVGSPVLYAYKTIGPIRLVPAILGDKSKAGSMLLKVESAAPLDVSR